MKFKSYIEQHLQDRGVIPYNPDFPVYIDKDKDVAYFPLFNLSGKFVGYQRYNPKGDKGKTSWKLDNDDKKYYTYVTKENPDKNISYIALYGLHTLDKRNYVFIVEGIFDAVKFIKIKEPIIAVLANHPKYLKNFFKVLNKKVIAIMDNDDAGSKLKMLSDYNYIVPHPYKDIGDMTTSNVRSFINNIKKTINIK